MVLLVPTILSGGAGSRLWPVSREMHPTPFIQLADGTSLVQMAVERAGALPDVGEILTITNREFFFRTTDEYEAAGGAKVPLGFVLEPMGRDTAAAVASAALAVQKAHGDSGIVLILPADHLIQNLAAFNVAVKRAVELAEEGKLVTFGIQPTHAETAFGYIEADGEAVKRFVEKPDLATAESYLRAGNFHWNSGMFCFSAGKMIAEMETHCPEILDATRKALDAAKTISEDGLTAHELTAEAFEAVPKNSIDYAVMEKAEGVAVVPCNIGWSDIGSWNAMSDLAPADDDGNRIEGDVMIEGATNTYVRAEGRLIGVVGVKDLLVIDSADALLVASREYAQDVKAIFKRLKEADHEAQHIHLTAFRPWGSYTILDEGEGYKVKRIEVKPGAKLSLQSHNHRSEHWTVVQGVATVVNGDEEITLNVNESVYIPCGSKHRMANPGTKTMALIEVQSGDYLGEDDIVRYEDVYGRQ
ncbi:MAG: mannose-1-phosphate guanylyltransferase/mannose-6-phosphate isomerase [Rhizobiaceae bacterium]